MTEINDIKCFNHPYIFTEFASLIKIRKIDEVVQLCL